LEEKIHFSLVICGSYFQSEQLKSIKKKTILDGSMVARRLQFYDLAQVMRQENLEFSQTFTQIGNGENLLQSQQELIESRFFTQERADELCHNGLRFLFKKVDVDTFNRNALNTSNKITAIAKDAYLGCDNAKQLASSRQAVHKKCCRIE